MLQRVAPGASFSPEDGTVAGRTERSVNSREMIVNHPALESRTTPNLA
jgi:hypothetical protein